MKGVSELFMGAFFTIIIAAIVMICAAIYMFNYKIGG